MRWLQKGQEVHWSEEHAGTQRLYFGIGACKIWRGVSPNVWFSANFTIFPVFPHFGSEVGNQCPKTPHIDPFFLEFRIFPPFGCISGESMSQNVPLCPFVWTSWGIGAGKRRGENGKSGWVIWGWFVMENMVHLY